MEPDAIWVILGLCLFSGGAWGKLESEETGEAIKKSFAVSISGNRVELKCPGVSGRIEWKHNDKKLPEESEELLVLNDFSEMENSGYYECKSTDEDEIFNLYLKARVCESCIEANVMAVVTIIVVDICVTLGLLLVVYYWSKNRKAKAKPVTRGTGAGNRSRGQNKERPPPVPNPDYEPIRKGQRDLYSSLNQRNV